MVIQSLATPLKYVGVTELGLLSFLRFSLDGSEWWNSRSDCFTPLPRYPLSWSMGGSRSRSGRFEEGKICLSLSGIEPQNNPCRHNWRAKGGVFECLKRWPLCLEWLNALIWWLLQTLYYHKYSGQLCDTIKLFYSISLHRVSNPKFLIGDFLLHSC